MNRSILQVVAAAALGLSLVIPASATIVTTGTDVTDTGPLGQQWTANWSGRDVYGMGTDLSINANTLSYNFQHPGYAYNGAFSQTYVFTTTAQQAGDLNLSVDLSSFAAWWMADTTMSVWQGSTDNATQLAGDTWGGVSTQPVDLNLTAGEQWGFIATGGNYDGTGILEGSFTVTQVPEPASLALLGLGFAGMGVLRRKKKA